MRAGAAAVTPGPPRGQVRLGPAHHACRHHHRPDLSVTVFLASASRPLRIWQTAWASRPDGRPKRSSAVSASWRIPRGRLAPCSAPHHVSAGGVCRLRRSYPAGREWHRSAVLDIAIDRRHGFSLQRRPFGEGGAPCGADRSPGLRDLIAAALTGQPVTTAVVDGPPVGHGDDRLLAVAIPTRHGPNGAVTGAAWDWRLSTRSFTGCPMTIRICRRRACAFTIRSSGYHAVRHRTDLPPRTWRCWSAR